VDATPDVLAAQEAMEKFSVEKVRVMELHMGARINGGEGYCTTYQTRSMSEVDKASKTHTNMPILSSTRRKVRHGIA
jgi:hypothetical protein